MRAKELPSQHGNDRRFERDPIPNDTTTQRGNEVEKKENLYVVGSRCKVGLKGRFQMANGMAYRWAACLDVRLDHSDCGKSWSG
jgi:hypothetical protein